MGSAGTGLGSGTTGKLGRAWVGAWVGAWVHGGGGVLGGEGGCKLEEHNILNIIEDQHSSLFSCGLF